MSANPIPDAKPMKGKYDGRRFNGAHLRRSERGPKPKYLSKLSRQQSKAVLSQLATIASWADIFRMAIDAKDHNGAASILERVENRYFGKPYVSVNPEASESKPAATDPRILVAIQNLIPGQQPTKSKRSKVIEATTVEAKALPAASPETSAE